MWRWRYSHAADADVSVVRLQRLPRFIDGVALQVCGVQLTVVGAEQRLEGFESRIIARGVGGGGGAHVGSDMHATSVNTTATRAPGCLS